MVIGQDLGNVRHIAVAPNGDVFAAVVGPKGGLHVLRDTTGDGVVDVDRRINEIPGTGVLLAGDAVYFAPNDRILRYPWKKGALEPAGPADTIAMGLPVEGHSAKGMVFGSDGGLYVTFGSRTNSCQVKDRSERSPGVNPCTELDERAGIWRFDARRKGQTPKDAKRFATGLRNPEAMAVEPHEGMLYMAAHGRDQLAENWGFPAEDGRENPAEEFGPVTEGANYGWPYCYYDPRARKKVKTPEYGGDGKTVGDCGKFAQPTIGFPAHWAPESLKFYVGQQFPMEYRGGAFIAFHGSWNRGPTPQDQQGFRVVFIPFEEGKPTGRFEDFALPAGAPNAIRPMGLAVGPDGSLYIGSDAQQKIWRVFYRP
jgi:glucose/arabinose dehydrogenase